MNAGKRLAGAVVGLVGLGLVTGCGPTIADLPLPGNGVSGDTIEVKIQFDEALNLSRGAAVKVNGVNSGKVRSVEAEDFKAVAVLEVRKDANMRADATARLRYTTPLGELFVDVQNPAEGDLLRDGGSLDPLRSTTAPTVEDALSSASLLVNGGGLNQLQTVTEELNSALGGREGKIRELLTQANLFLSQANETTPEIDRALNSLAEVSKILNDNRAVIKAALRDVAPAAAVLRENTPGLTKLLDSLAEFSATANDTVGKTRQDLVQMVRQVGPVLQEFLDSRAVFGPSLDALVDVGKMLDNVAPGDYLQLRLVIDAAGITPPDLLGLGGGGSTGQNGDGTGGLIPGLKVVPERAGIATLLGGE